MTAFTNIEKSKIRRYLGFSELWRDLDSRLEGQLNDLPERNPDAADQVREYIAQLDAIWAKLNSAAISNLDVIRADEVTFRGPEQLMGLREQGRMLVQAIAITFYIDPPRDIFSSGTAGGLVALG